MSVEMFKLLFAAGGFALCMLLSYLFKIDLVLVVASMGFLVAMRNWAENLFYTLLIQQNEAKILELTKQVEENNESSGKPE